MTTQVDPPAEAAASDKAPPIALTITLHDAAHRRRAHAMIDRAADKCRVTIAEPKRSDEQNDKMWAMITDVMKQKPGWFGPGLDKDDIKQIFMSSLFKELRMARNADGDGYIPLSRRSSKLTIRQMSDLIALIDSWGAREGVVWTEPKHWSESAQQAAPRAA